MRFNYRLLISLLLITGVSNAADDVLVNDVVVTAPRMEEPLKVVTDPKAPRQPVPAHDGADYLKTIPGFSVMRKGGTDGEPILRGMAGSRLGISVDGQNILGGCSMRMDAPTSYIFPEAFDQLTVMKGPQTVINGSGNSAGSVMFDRHLHPMSKTGMTGNASLLFGSYGRHDEVVDAKFGNANVYTRITGTNSESNGYRDGDDNQVHSEYRRYSANAAIGFTPDADTGLEISAAFSDGEAAYADRGMDGVKFRRENIGVRFEKRNITPWLEKLSFNISHNDIDHVMDDFSLRRPAMALMGWAELKHRTNEAKLLGVLRISEATETTLGANYQYSVHAKASGGATGMFAMMLPAVAMSDDSSFEDIGLFAEFKHDFGNRNRVVAGYRMDHWQAQDQRGSGISAGRSRDETLNSGFARLESDLTDLPVTTYVGLGHSERFPDYWELIPSVKDATGASAFLSTNPEKTDQLDLGFVSNFGKLRLSVSAFYNEINDFILIDRNLGAGMASASRNINAHSYGGELDLAYVLAEHWKLSSSLAYVRGENETDSRPLAQLPPLEMKLGLHYDNKTWFAGGLLRMVSEQDRYAVGQGNIAGTDIGRSGGFSVFSLNGGWRPTSSTLVSAGVDNLFDKKYAEFVSRAGGNGMGGTIPGFEQTTRVNEPGRTFWIKGNINF